MVATALSVGMHFLLTKDLAPILIPYIEPETLRSFVYSSDYASYFFQGFINDVCLDRYSELHARAFPKIESTNAHFLKDACTCALSLSGTHGIYSNDLDGRQFSDAYWQMSSEYKAIVRAVRLQRWCREREGVSAMTFFMVCFKAEFRTRRWWHNLLNWQTQSPRFNSSRLEEY